MSHHLTSYFFIGITVVSFHDRFVPSRFVPCTSRTQALLFPCRRNINFCLIRTRKRQKLHNSSVHNIACVHPSNSLNKIMYLCEGDGYACTVYCNEPLGPIIQTKLRKLSLLQNNGLRKFLDL